MEIVFQLKKDVTVKLIVPKITQMNKIVHFMSLLKVITKVIHQLVTSTTLYITCIAGCQYNFIHITRILFNFANYIAGCQYNFIHISYHQNFV
jgi:hypothetical protein